MRDLLKGLKGCRLIAKGQEGRDRVVLHYLFPDGRVLEVVHRRTKRRQNPAHLRPAPNEGNLPLMRSRFASS